METTPSRLVVSMAIDITNLNSMNHSVYGGVVMVGGLGKLHNLDNAMAMHTLIA